MSVDTIAVVISAAGLMLGFVAALAWMIRRTDAQFDRLSGEIGAVRHELGERISRVEHELVEVKIAVARIEGPPRRLLPAR